MNIIVQLSPHYKVTLSTKFLVKFWTALVKLRVYILYASTKCKHVIYPN